MQYVRPPYHAFFIYFFNNYFLLRTHLRCVHTCVLRLSLRAAVDVCFLMARMFFDGTRKTTKRAKERVYPHSALSISIFFFLRQQFFCFCIMRK